jgi:hypothetical protein
MKKIFSLLFILCLALPVSAETIIFTNGTKLMGCHFDSENCATCFNGLWAPYQCNKDGSGACIRKIVPDNKFDKFRSKIDDFGRQFAACPQNTNYENNSLPQQTFYFPNYAGGYYGVSSNGQTTILTPSYAGGYYGYSY